jgi:hypothetical protein
MILDALLALGLLLTSASELRLASVPIGPDSVILVVWGLLRLFREIGRLESVLTPALYRLLIFWLVFGIALSIGTLAGYAIGDVHDHDLFVHDIFAYLLSAVVSCLSVAGPDARVRLQRTAWFLAGFGSLSLAFLVAVASGMVHAELISPWYWDRFRGWSSNPVQMALLCAVLTLVAFHLADEAIGISRKIAALAFAVLPIYAGRLTKSDSFTAALVGAIPIFVALKFRGWLVAPSPKPAFGRSFAWIVTLSLPLLLISLIPLRSVIDVQARNMARGLSKGGDEIKTSEREAQLRILTWKEGISRGVESGMLGLGPGPHLRIPNVLVTARELEALPKYVDTPPVNGTPDFEAHNTPIDLFAQGGLIAVLDFIWISATAFFWSYKARKAGLTALLCGVSIFGIANLIVRQPLFWLVIALCLVPRAAALREPARNWS